ncbi:hypothetical protein B9Z19DRAFT_634784 [Tuber borchii]|uniref:Uncharacterized protein n=1 Tax=Tuber borchii TaxID=42251 RepID=A0A2T7A0P4_TUBBO|nr:hypothetical protein B9Z19DRAFT_634784 [Tuber borchii]
MTSNTSNNTSIPQAPTINSTASNQSAHQRTSSLSSGQNSSSAAVTASAPTSRPVSYATRAAQPANTSNKPVSSPVIAATPSSSSIGGAPAQNVRPGSTASTPVNGKISPAVGNAGAGIANGAPTPYPGGQHSRKSSVASGTRGPAIPNGGRINISFGTLNDAGTAPSSGPANAATNASLTAPMAPNPRASSPQPPASAASQPAASGGAPPVAPATSGRGNIQFGDATQVCISFLQPLTLSINLTVLIEPEPEACFNASPSSGIDAQPS